MNPIDKKTQGRFATLQSAHLEARFTTNFHGEPIRGPPHGQAITEYNVLVLGETQSGKSTLIQHMRKYADPRDVDIQALGDSLNSHTMEVSSTTITTDLPEFHVIEDNGERLRYGEYMMSDDTCDYDELLGRRDLMLEKGHPRLVKKVQFNLIDTPGLNTTVGDDETHIQKIFDTLVKTKTIHLVLITVSCRHGTQGFKDVVQAYADLFPWFKGIIAFVHTHFDYENLHPARTKESQTVQAVAFKAESLHEIMGRSTFPHFKIDCHVNNRVIRDCMTRNTIQKILELATFNCPVEMPHTVINKTLKMRIIDSILRDKFEAVNDNMIKTLLFKDAEQGELLDGILRRETQVHELEAEIEVVNNYLAHHDVGQLELLHEDRRELDYVEGGEGEKGSIRYPEIGESTLPIARIDVHCQGVAILSETRGKNDEEWWTSWQAEVQRTTLDHAVLHVRIYSTKAHVHQVEIERKREESAALRRKLQEAIQYREEHCKCNESNEERIKELVDILDKGIQVLRQARYQSLSPETYKALVEHKAYDGSIGACAKKVQKVYIAQAQLRADASQHGQEAKRQEVNHLLQEIDPERQEPSSERQNPIAEGQERGHWGKELYHQSIGSKLLEEVPQSIYSPNFIAEPSTTTIQTYSVLVLGNSQAGKSTFVEHIKKYASPGYTIDQSRLGGGIFSKTEKTNTTLITSTLPSYEVSIKQTGAVINIDNLRQSYVNLKGTRAHKEHFQELLFAHDDNSGPSPPDVHNTGAAVLKGRSMDEEDALDLLFSREDKFDLHMSLEHSSLDNMEFEILDTPGICTHNGKDEAHAVAIINGIVSARRFNLILIVVNIHDPLTAEQLLAFQYCSKILDGLHSNIAFLYTHADYSHYLHLNEKLQLELASKTRALSRIFQSSISDDFELYPSFTIGFTESNLPVIQCMIRNTLKDILQLAVWNPPVLVDASSANTERIRGITHPFNFNDVQRRAALKDIFGDTPSQPTVSGDPLVTSSDPLVPSSDPILQNINILVIGDLQSGKSSLIEAMKVYADPNSMVDNNGDNSLVIRGVSGSADEIISGVSFITDLHTIEICRGIDTNGDRNILSVEEESQTSDYTKFIDILEEENIHTRASHPTSVSRKYQFTIYEAPGLQIIDSQQGMASTVHKAIYSSNKVIHQVLVTLDRNSITTSTITVIEYLVRTVAKAGSLFAFVHTNFDYCNLHVSKSSVQDALEQKKALLQTLVRTNPPIFAIDSNLEVLPVRRAITLNTIHDILLAAVTNNPRYSVLILGRTQSGKSRLIQHIKKYADPTHTFNYSLLGNGITSKTKSVEQFFVHSNLPAYEVVEIATGATLDLHELSSRFDDENDYFDVLRSREKFYTLRMVSQNPQESPSELVEFRFLDTPGINDTDHCDDILATGIVNEIISTRSYNLILITASAHFHLSMEYGLALEYYAKVLQGLHANIAFLYTHVSYTECHHSNTKHQLFMRTRHNAFSKIFRDCHYLPVKNPGCNDDEEEMTLYRRFTIDLCSDARPVIQCLIQNTIRRILRHAIKSPPVDLDTSRSNCERIEALVHPNKSNRESRSRFQANMLKETQQLS